MEVGWKEAFWKAGNKIMKEGGKLEMVVVKRGRDRIPIIHTYPDNQVVCKKETMID